MEDYTDSDNINYEEGEFLIYFTFDDDDNKFDSYDGFYINCDGDMTWEIR